MPQRNLAVELLRKLLSGEIHTRRRTNVVQARSFAEMLEHSIRRYQNRAIEAAQVVEELIGIAKDIRAANAQVALRIAFIAHSAALMGDAIVRSLYRTFVSRKMMLEWRTAAQAACQTAFIGRAPG